MVQSIWYLKLSMQTYILPELTLESGDTLQQAAVAYQTWGTLNACGDNAIIVCHALTGNTSLDEWWGGLLGPGKALDTDRYFVIAANALGSPYGSASPITLNPDTGRPYGIDFPQTTTRDTIAAHKALLEHLEVQQLAMAIGGSMGGMHVLEWSFYGDFIRTIVPIAVGGRHSAWCIAWSEAQRQAIYADPAWKEGRYREDEPPAGGLAAARMMAMVSYRSMPSFADRFGRQKMQNTGEPAPYSVESYLRYQGAKLVQRFDANCYIRLTEQMDSHDVARGRGNYEDVLRSIEQPALVVGIESDVLYTLPEQKELVDHLPNATLKVLSSIHGHDAFLIELESLNEIVVDWMNVHLHSENLPLASLCP